MAPAGRVRVAPPKASARPIPDGPMTTGVRPGGRSPVRARAAAAGSSRASRIRAIARMPSLERSAGTELAIQHGLKVLHGCGPEQATVGDPHRLGGDGEPLM